MNRHYVISYLMLFCLMLAGCGGDSVLKPTEVQNADRYTEDGLHAFSEGNWNRAKNLFSRALSVNQGIDNQLGVLYSHINLAEVGLSIADYQLVQKHLERATEIAKAPAFQHYQPRITLLSAQSELKQKHYHHAEKVLQSLLPQFNGVEPTKAYDMIQLSAIATRVKIAFVIQRDESLWTQRYAHALALSKINSAALENRLLRFQSGILQRQQQHKEAESYLQRALAGYKKTESRQGIAATLSELGRLAMIQSHWQDAQNYFIRSSDVFRYLGDMDNVIHNTEYLVKVESKLGNLERSNRFREWLMDRKVRMRTE